MQPARESQRELVASTCGGATERSNTMALKVRALTATRLFTIIPLCRHGTSVHAT